MSIPQWVFDSDWLYQEFEYNSLKETIRTYERAKEKQNLGFDEIERLSQRLKLDTQVREKARDILNDSLNTGMIQRYSMSLLSVTSVYMACRATQTPRSLTDFHRLYDVRVEIDGDIRIKFLRNRREIGRAYRQMKDSLGRSYPRIEPERFLNRYCSGLETDGETKETAQVVIKTINDSAFSGNPPGSVAAGAILYTSSLENKGITPQKVSYISNYTEATVRKRKREIKKELEG